MRYIKLSPLFDLVTWDNFLMFLKGCIKTSQIYKIMVKKKKKHYRDYYWWISSLKLITHFFRQVHYIYSAK